MDTLEFVDNILVHYGKKGMRWGVRGNSTGGSTAVIVRDKGKKLKTSGGKGFPAHADAVRARTLGQKGKASGLKALSDKELQDYSRRLNLEQGAKRLAFNDKNAGQKFVATLLGQTGKNAVTEVANSVTSDQVKKHIVSKLVK